MFPISMPNNISNEPKYTKMHEDIPANPHLGIHDVAVK